MFNDAPAIYAPHAAPSDEQPTHESGLTMHVFLGDGLWHRRAATGRHTACGIATAHHDIAGHRYESYEGKLCTGGCFTGFELAANKVINDTAAAERAATDITDHAKFFNRKNRK